MRGRGPNEAAERPRETPEPTTATGIIRTSVGHDSNEEPPSGRPSG